MNLHTNLDLTKHGYGMKSIDKIDNKYHGSHIEQFDENEFTISIMLMI